MTVINRQPAAVLQQSVVVFSRAYLPLARINIKRAIVLLVTGQAESLDFGDAQVWEVRSQTLILQVPEYIRLLMGNPERHWKVPPVNRREVLKRDQHRCQYCRSPRKLTLDHVMPRSRGPAPVAGLIPGITLLPPAPPATPAKVIARP